MVAPESWVLMAYRLPREPSTPRISLWRKLRRLGAAQLSDGLVALPADARTTEQLEWLADEVIEAGGESSMWFAEPATPAQRRALVRRMMDGVAEEYRVIVAAAHSARDEEAAARRRVLLRLRREIYRIERRDYFPPPERDAARAAVEALAADLEPVA